MPESALSQRQVFSPSTLNGLLRGMLENSVPLLWIEGEISNLRPSSSPHWYFSVKDPSAEVRCVMFRNRNQLLKWKPANGERVLLRARVTLYEPRGDLQLQVEHMEPQGIGALMRQLEETRARLSAEGVFAVDRKRTLPKFPTRLAVITSAQGAAWHDVRTVLERRWPMLRIDLVPSLVQGVDAPAQLLRALAFANRGEYDLILITRGGGSIEDLFAFNDEALVRAIAASPLPVVAAIGHEVDVTLAELAADLRAATPSAAAELVAPDQAEMFQRLDDLQDRLRAAGDSHVGRARLKLTVQGEALRAVDPVQQVRHWRTRLDTMRVRLAASQAAMVSLRQKQLSVLRHGLMSAGPALRLQQATARCTRAEDLLRAAMTRRIETESATLKSLGSSLHVLSPLSTLERGYAIALHEGVVLTDAANVASGANVEIRLANGQLQTTVR